MTRHGTLAGYKSDGCRCDRCTEANAAYMRRKRGSQKKGPAWATAQVNYMINPVWEPDTLTRGELMAERGYV